MDENEIDKVIKSINDSNLLSLYKKSVKAGDAPYKRNRETLKFFDIQDDLVKGTKSAKSLIKEIDVWIKTLKEVENAANKVSRSIRSIS